MPETTPLIKAALNLRVGARTRKDAQGFDVYNKTGQNTYNKIKKAGQNITNYIEKTGQKRYC